ncbi:hypothetical protein [Aeromicrobium panaciterrae]|uniref:hypothetical protein n=1 Tax=Aeromicrobium panaciterrae TaxID=363861 RepID=UPI0031D5317A
MHIRPWRDPRLLIGVLLVLGSTILGARLVAAGDETAQYWALDRTVAAGDPVSSDDLVAVRVKLTADVSDNYLRTDEEFAAPLDSLQWAERAAGGTLVERSALLPKATVGRSQLPLSVASGASPADLARGDLVDVWVGPGPGDQSDDKAIRVLQSVRIVETGDESVSVGGSLAQTVLVDVADTQLEGSVIGTVSSGHVTLVRVS